MNTLLPKFWTHGSNTRELSGTQETSLTCSVNVKFTLRSEKMVGKRKRYQLVDNYEDYGYIGEYNTLEELKKAASEWEEDTDGECDLELQEWYEPLGEYLKIIE